MASFLRRTLVAGGQLSSSLLKVAALVHRGGQRHCPRTTLPSCHARPASDSTSTSSQGPVPYALQSSSPTYPPQSPTFALEDEELSPSNAPSDARSRTFRHDSSIHLPMSQFMGKFTHDKLPATKRLQIQLNGQKLTSYDNVFLRDACSCAKCVHPSTKQKLFQTADIPMNIHPIRAGVHSDGKLHITWNYHLENGEEEATGAEPHQSVYDYTFLRRYSMPISIIRDGFNDFRQVLWDNQVMNEDVLWIEYDEYMTSEVMVHELVHHLNLYGLAFLRNVPDGVKQNAPKGVAERIGNLKTTFYGDTWDVKSVKDSKNIAYTSLNLGLHMDLLYFESPPGIQFLHCLRNSVTGGASIFADAFRAATQLRLQSPPLFNSLLTFPVPYTYNNDSQHYHFTRPTIVMEELASTHLDSASSRRISHMNWAPPFQAPFTLDHDGKRVNDSSLWRQYVIAAKNFNRLIQNPGNQYELTLRPGDCAVFQNRRVLHARREFDTSSGERWLKGAYLDIDTFKSAYRVLSAKYKGVKQSGTGKARETRREPDYHYLS